MRMVRRLAALATGAAVVLVSAPQAAAGGVTSVLVASPESGQTKALDSTDGEFGALQSLLGAPNRGQSDMPPGLEVGNGTRQINVTWLLHDVQPGRVDHVYPRTKPTRDTGAAQDIWIHTSMDMETMDGSWHKAEDPARLRALLKDIGMLGKASKNGSAGIPPPAWSEPEEETSPSRAADQEAGPVYDDSTGWRWAMSGAAGGAVVGVAGMLLLRRRGPQEEDPGPRQELVDIQEVSWRRE
ncbi:hypothetical protein [Streptomyces sp. NPDC003006]